MKNTKIRTVGVAAVVALWAMLTALLWFGPRKDLSEAERRPLDQMPEITMETILNGKFMSEFEDFTLDQFPFRDTIRQVKSLFHYYVLGQKDSNDIYIADGYAVKQEYPYNPQSIDYAVGRFNYLYDKYLADSGSQIYLTVAPDKGYYLAESSGHLTMDYAAMFAALQEGMPWAAFVDLTDSLTAGDYYRTDTHWRQENLIPAAQKLCEALGVTGPQAQDFTMQTLDRPFYGVYYGQAALPMEPDALTYLSSPVLDACNVYDYETGMTVAVHDLTKADSKDLYDVFLSGSKSLLTIENPNASSDRELIVFRDSFGSSLVPLLVQDYAKVTLVDIRYMHIDMVGRFVEFNGQDVLFLYSTLVLNNSSTIK